MSPQAEDRPRRNGRRWSPPGPVVAVALLALAAPSSLPALPHASETWIRADTAHFTLFSNVSQTYTEAIGHQLELFRHVVAGLNPDLEINSPLPAYVFVFRNAQSFEPYKVRFVAGPTGLDAYFQADRDANYIAINATPEDDWYAPVYHEFVHYFLNNNFTYVPLWFNEGLAEYYSTFRLNTEGKAEIGLPVKSAAAWLRGHRLMPLSQLFAITVHSPDYNEEDRQGGYYSQCWALVHYLLWGKPGWRTQLSDRVARLDAGETLISLVPMRNYKDLENDFARYVQQERYRSILVDAGGAGVTSAARIISIDRAELLYRLGDLLARLDSGKEKQAEAHFREAIRIDPSHAASYAGLGFLRDGDGRHKEATPYYEKALSLDPNDYMTAFLYATNLRRIALGEAYATIPILDQPPPDLLRARELFRRSLELRPGLAEAHAGLGSTYFVAAEDPQEGIDALETARGLLPSRMEIVFHLMQLYPRVDRRDEAQRLMDEVFSQHASAEQIAMARDMLLRADMMRAGRLMEAGRHDEAMALLHTLREAAATPEMQAALDATIAVKLAWLKQHDETDTLNRHIARYNEAATLAKEHDFERAAALLETLAAEVKDDDLRRQARDTLLQVNLMQAERMMEEGRYEEGMAFLDTLRKASVDPKLRAAMEAQIERAQAWLKQRDVVERHNRQVDRYNEAVRRANGGDLRGAIAILETLVPEASDADLRKQAGDLLRRVREASGKPVSRD